MDDDALASLQFDSRASAEERQRARREVNRRRKAARAPQPGSTRSAVWMIAAAVITAAVNFAAGMLVITLRPGNAASDRALGSLDAKVVLVAVPIAAVGAYFLARRSRVPGSLLAILALAVALAPAAIVLVGRDGPASDRALESLVEDHLQMRGGFAVHPVAGFRLDVRGLEVGESLVNREGGLEMRTDSFRHGEEMVMLAISEVRGQDSLTDIVEGAQERMRAEGATFDEVSRTPREVRVCEEYPHVGPVCHRFVVAPHGGRWFVATLSVTATEEQARPLLERLQLPEP